MKTFDKDAHCDVMCARDRGTQTYLIVLLFVASTCHFTSFASLADAGSLIAGPRAVGAFQSEDDGLCHAVVAQTNGNIVDVTHDCHGGGVAASVLAQLDDPVAVCGYYARNDHFRHVIVGLSNGDLFDIRFKPGIAPAPIRLVNIHDFGPIKSLASWTDVHDNKNIAILTTWLNAQVVSVYQANVGRPGSMHYLSIFPATNMIDIAGQYVYWDNSNKIQLAVGQAGESSSMKMISWSADVVPDQWNFASGFEGTNTPWVTSFPGASTPGEAVVSMGGNSGYYSIYAPWSAIVGLIFLNVNHEIKFFGANNGGGTIGPGSFTFPAAAQSIAGPHFTGIASGPLPRIQVVVGADDGRLFSLSASQPSNPQGTPAWAVAQIGAF